LWLAPGLREVAWSTDADASTLCAITSTDTYWIDRRTWKSRVHEGENAAAVAYDSNTGRWALPSDTRFCLRWLVGEGFTATPEAERWPLVPAAKGQASQVGLAASAAGRLAIFAGKRLQFAKGGQLEPLSRSVVTGTGGGEYRGLLWDSAGRTATVVYAADGRLRAENYTTGPEKTALLGAVPIAAQRLTPAVDGIHLIARGVDSGICRVHMVSGEVQSIDTGIEARQDAPVAVSADGRWIAAVADGRLIRLLDAYDGRRYADLTCPRSTEITSLAWHPSGNWLAALTADGFVQIYSLVPWRDWLARHGLAK
jgi:hypothetical protein